MAAGSQDSISAEIGVTESAAVTHFIRIFSALKDGNLPVEWLSASPSSAFVRAPNTIQTTITINVPDDAAPGVYKGYVMAEARGSHNLPDPGAGLFISVNVPAVCSGIPEVRLDRLGPEILWPPDHSLRAVTAQGTILLPAGCTLVEAEYRIDDEYGVYSAAEKFAVAADGSFTLVLPLEAWRKGQDRNGREYGVTISVRNEAGTGTSETMKVLVPHDQRPDML